MLSLTAKSALDALRAYTAKTTSYLMLHIDATFKLNHLNYPVIVVGFSDANRKFIPLVMSLVSHLTEEDYAQVILLN